MNATACWDRPFTEDGAVLPGLRQVRLLALTSSARCSSSQKLVWQDAPRPVTRPQRWHHRCLCPPGALSVFLAVASVLPQECGAALSVSSGYESFLINIRRRIVVEEDDVVDEAKRRGRAQPCDSMKDG